MSFGAPTGVTLTSHNHAYNLFNRKTKSYDFVTPANSV